MTTQPSRTLVVGESLIDIVENVRGRVEHVGGSPLNVAVGLARLGGAVDLATAIGQDALGQAILAHASASGVRLINRASDPAQRTSTATAVIQEDGSARYDFAISWNISPLDSEGYSALHTGSIGATLRPGSARVRELFSRASPGVLRSFDPNIRPGVLGERDEVIETVSGIARHCHIVKLSDEDADWLHPGEDAERVTDRYRRFGAALVIVTRGGNGYALRCGDRFCDVPAKPAKVVDTIGAGDSFMAGLLFALRSARKSILDGRADPEFVGRAAAFAASCAAVTVGRSGADLPRRAAVPAPLP